MRGDFPRVLPSADAGGHYAPEGFGPMPFVSEARRVGRWIAAFGLRHSRHDPQANRDQGADDDPGTGNMEQIGPISQPAKQDKKAEDVKAECGQRNLPERSLP